MKVTSQRATVALQGGRLRGGYSPLQELVQRQELEDDLP